MTDGKACLSEQDSGKALDAIAEQIRQQIADPVLIGIETGGAVVAEILAKKVNCPLGKINVSFYRDDFQRIGLHPIVTPSKLPLDLENRNLVLVDDVIYSGRTVRAALNEVFDYGRPASVTLAVMIDRNGRELPIQPDFTGTRIEIAENQYIKMHANPVSFSVITK